MPVNWPIKCADARYMIGILLSRIAQNPPDVDIFNEFLLSCMFEARSLIKVKKYQQYI